MTLLTILGCDSNSNEPEQLENLINEGVGTTGFQIDTLSTSLAALPIENLSEG